MLVARLGEDGVRRLLNGFRVSDMKDEIVWGGVERYFSGQMLDVQP